MEQRPKELHPKLPVVNETSPLLKDKKVLGQYDCPVYYTTLRGATYIFRANLNMESEDSDPNKWILSGTCLLLSDDWGKTNVFKMIDLNFIYKVNFFTLKLKFILILKYDSFYKALVTLNKKLIKLSCWSNVQTLLFHCPKLKNFLNKMMARRPLSLPKDKKFSNKCSDPNGEWPQNASSKVMKANRFFTFA